MALPCLPIEMTGTRGRTSVLNTLRLIDKYAGALPTRIRRGVMLMLPPPAT